MEESRDISKIKILETIKDAYDREAAAMSDCEIYYAKD